MLGHEPIKTALSAYSDKELRTLAIFMARGFSYFMRIHDGSKRQAEFHTHLECVLISQPRTTEFSWPIEDERVISIFCTYAVQFAAYAVNMQKAHFISEIYHNMNSVFSVIYFNSLDEFDIRPDLFFEKAGGDDAYKHVSEKLFALFSELEVSETLAPVMREVEIFGRWIDAFWMSTYDELD